MICIYIYMYTPPNPLVGHQFPISQTGQGVSHPFVRRVYSTWHRRKDACRNGMKLGIAKYRTHPFPSLKKKHLKPSCTFEDSQYGGYLKLRDGIGISLQLSGRQGSKHVIYQLVVRDLESKYEQICANYLIFDGLHIHCISSKYEKN